MFVDVKNFGEEQVRQLVAGAALQVAQEEWQLLQTLGLVVANVFEGQVAMHYELERYNEPVQEVQLVLSVPEHVAQLV